MKKSYNELLNDVKIQEEQKKVQAQKEKLIEEKITIESRIRFSKSMVQQFASSLEELKNRLKQISNLKNKLFNRNIYKRNKSELELEIKLKTEYLEKYDTETKLLENRYAEIKKNLNDLKDDIKIQKELPLKMLDGFIYINSDNLNYLPTKEISDATNIDEKMLIHSTNFFPKDGKILTGVEGHKIEKKVDITYKDFKRTFSVYSSRNTVHFILNNVVSNHMYGVFPDDYIILEPLRNHVDQIVSENPSDTWTRGSVTLSKDAIILVKKNKLKKIPEELRKKYNIILYDGDRKICVENLLDSMGYQVSKIDLGYAGHAHSIDAELETCIRYRNRMISFFEDKMVYNNNFFLNEEKMLTLYDLYKNSFCIYDVPGRKFLNVTVTESLCKKQNLNFDVFEFFINFGMRKKNNNYIPLSYDEMLEIRKIINDEHFGEIQFNNLIKELGMSDFQEKLIQNNKSKKNEATMNEKELLTRPFSEINNFENLNSAAELQRYINQIFTSKEASYVSTSFDFNNCLNVEFYVDKTDLESYLNDSYDIKIEDDPIDNNLKKVLFNLDCSDLLCEEVIEQCIKYVSKINKLTHKKI